MSILLFLVIVAFAVALKRAWVRISEGLEREAVLEDKLKKSFGDYIEEIKGLKAALIEANERADSFHRAYLDATQLQGNLEKQIVSLEGKVEEAEAIRLQVGGLLEKNDLLSKELLHQEKVSAELYSIIEKERAETEANYERYEEKIEELAQLITQLRTALEETVTAAEMVGARMPRTKERLAAIKAYQKRTGEKSLTAAAKAVDEKRKGK